MPRLVHKRAGKRVNIWLDAKSLKTANQIDNLSNFFQMALGQASSIMAFDIIVRERNLPNVPEPTPEAVEEFNTNHPQNPLTQKRQNTHGTSQSLYGDETTNPFED